MRKLFSFVEPSLRITYLALYEELAGHLQVDVEGAFGRFAPDEAIPALHYFRRQTRRREASLLLAARLGVAPELVYEACTPDGAEKLLASA